MISLTLIIGFVVLLTSGALQAEEWGGLTATPGSLWHSALENSSEIQASRYSAESKQSLYLGSGRLPDPMFRIGFSPSPLETRNGPVDFTATLSQRIPWPGILAGSRERMSYLAEAANIDETVTELKLRTEITSLWASMYRTRELMNVLSEEIERLEHLMELAEIRYRSGQSGLSLLLSLENRVEIIRARLYGTELEYESLMLEMAVLTGSEDLRLVWPDSVPELEFFQNGIVNAIEVLEMPLVRRSFAVVRSERAAADAARAAQYPGLELGATWSVIGEPDVEMGAVDPGQDAFTVFAGISIPLGYSGSAHNSEAASLSSTSSEYMHMQLMADQEAARQRSVNLIMSLLDIHVTYSNTVVPNIRAMYQLAVTDWISGRTGIETVIDLLDELEEARLEKIRTYSEIVVNFAKLLEIEGRNTMEGDFL